MWFLTYANIEQLTINNYIFPNLTPEVRQTLSDLKIKYVVEERLFVAHFVILADFDGACLSKREITYKNKSRGHNSGLQMR